MQTLAAATEDASALRLVAAWDTIAARACCIAVRQQVVQKNDGRFPQRSDALLKFRASDVIQPPPSPASRSREPVAVVDGNVERVLRQNNRE